jgi:hypothetical protein
MLVLCYGFPRSGSTLAWQLVRGVLVGAGWPQDDVSVPGLMASSFIPKEPERLRLSQKDLWAVLEAIGPDRIVAVKTHEPVQPRLLPWLDELQARRELQVVASYRDPRDICLSLLDAGGIARSRGEHAFSLLTTLEKAADSVERRIEHFRLWGAVRGALRLHYHTVAFEPEIAISAIATSLGLTCDLASVKAYAFDAAQQHRNRGIQERYKSELAAEELEMLTGRFRDFIEKVCERNDDSWFAQMRAEVLQRFGVNA